MGPSDIVILLQQMGVDVLNFFITPSIGSFITFGWFVSWVLEQFKWWQGIDSKMRMLIVGGFVVVLGVLGYFVSSGPKWFEPILPVFKIVMMAIYGWLTMQVSHNSDPKVKLERQMKALKSK